VPKVVCLSDTHNRHGAIDVPEGDVLIHAGDVSMAGRAGEVEAFMRWFAALPHPHKVLVAGNHDWLFERRPDLAREVVAGVTYLQDSGTEVAGLRIWGSPWQPWFYDWAFNLPRGEALREKWDMIPDGTDVLVTHGPPYGILDSVERVVGQWFGEDAAVEVEHTGCEELRAAVLRVGPRLNVFGHIHEGYGTDRLGKTICVNASNCDADYRPVNPAIVVELP